MSSINTLFLSDFWSEIKSYSINEPVSLIANGFCFLICFILDAIFDSDVDKVVET